MTDSRTPPPEGDRLAKVMARSGLCSRRDAEGWIKEGRVSVNGKVVKTPAFNVTEADVIKVDGNLLAERQGTRVWLYHKPAGLVVTEKDPEGRPTVFETLEKHGLPRVVSIGRLDINTEGLLLLTNDGGLKRVLEMPATGWLRRYRVRAFGSVTQASLDTLKNGVTIDGIKYGPIEATLERDQGSNVWLVVGLREGKNREVKNVLSSLGLQVNRLIRVSFGPFQLGDLPIGGVEVVKARILKDQLGKKLAEEADVDFESDMPEPAALALRKAATVAANERLSGRGSTTAQIGQQRFRFTDRADRPPVEREEAPARPGRPGRSGPARPPRPPRAPRPEEDGPVRQVLFDDGREPEVFKKKNFGKIQDSRTAEMVEAPRPPRAKKFDDKPAGDRTARSFGDKPKSFGDRPARSFGDKPKSFGDKPKSFGDRPKTFGDKPRGPRPAGDDRPKRPFGDKPRRDGGAPRPARSFDGKPRAPRPEGERPARSYGDRPARPAGDRPFSGKPRSEGAERPARSYGDKPRTPRPEGDRPARSYGDKPARPPRPAGDRPARSYGDKPARAPRPEGDRPARPFSDKPRPPRPAGGKPFAGKPGGRPAGGKPTGGKPSGPRTPRPPKTR